MAVPPISGGGPMTSAERSLNDYIKYGGNLPPPLGPLIRLHPKPLSALPFHPSLPTSPNQPSISSYSTALLLEAHTFMTAHVPRVFAVDTKAQISRPSTATVQLSSHKVPLAEVPYESRPKGDTGVAETWVARASEHVNAAEEGTTSWEEFEQGVGESGTGVKVQDVHVVLDWRKELGAEARLDEGEWEDVEAEVREEVVRMPAMVDDRVFVLLVVSARRDGEFLVVKVPVEGSGLPGSRYVGAGRTTTGHCVSVEHGVLTEKGTRYQWRKAISVDAGGMLPSWTQKMSGAGSLVKEVGIFMEDARKQRSDKSET